MLVILVVPPCCHFVFANLILSYLINGVCILLTVQVSWLWLRVNKDPFQTNQAALIIGCLTPWKHWSKHCGVTERCLFRWRGRHTSSSAFILNSTNQHGHWLKTTGGNHSLLTSGLFITAANRSRLTERLRNYQVGWRCLLHRTTSISCLFPPHLELSHGLAESR